MYKKPKVPPKPGTIRWGKHTGKRATCELCMLDIRNGKLRAPLATATQTATTEEKVWLLCRDHGTDVKYRGRAL